MKKSILALVAVAVVAAAVVLIVVFSRDEQEADLQGTSVQTPTVLSGSAPQAGGEAMRGQAPSPSRGLSITAREPDGTSTEIPLYSGYYALVIGCGDYRNGWQPLTGPQKDATEIAEMFREMGWTVDLLLDPDWKRLRGALNEVIIGPGRERDKAVAIWFSGHGHTLQEASGTKLGYIVPVDAPDPYDDELGFMNSAIDMRQVETVAKRIPAKHVLMLFDCCFSGAIFAMVRAKPSPFIEDKVGKPVRQFITAGTEDELVPDRSLFKTCFIQGVKDRYADRNRDGYVTGEEVGAYLAERVVNYTRSRQHPQYGKINDPKLDKGDFVFLLDQAGPETAKAPAAETAPGAQQAAEAAPGMTAGAPSGGLPGPGDMAQQAPGVPAASGQQGGSLLVESQPPGAQVSLQLGDKSLEGKTPHTFTDLEPGAAKLTAKLSGYRTKSETIHVKPGEQTSANLVLDKVVRKTVTEGSISVNSKPAGAYWYVNGVFEGKTPGKKTGVKRGEYKIAVKKTGYKSWEKSVDVGSGDREDLVAELEAVAPEEVETFIEPTTGMEFVLLPAGCITMGSPWTSWRQRMSHSDEGPAHEVCFNQFWMSRFETTNAQYRQFKKEHDSGKHLENSLNGDDQPVLQVSWDDAKAFAEWLTKRSGGEFEYRLPTEAQWEYACRARTTSEAYWGEGFSQLYENTAGSQDGYEGTAPVGCFQPNNFGLYDMLGNVLEWCEDGYSENAYGEHVRNNPRGPTGGKFRVVRGGNYQLSPDKCRSAKRFSQGSDVADQRVGFRLVRVPIEDKEQSN